MFALSSVILEEQWNKTLPTLIRVRPISFSVLEKLKDIDRPLFSVKHNFLCVSGTILTRKLNLQLLSGSGFFSIRRLIEASLRAAALPIYFSIILPADKYFDVSVLLQRSSVTWKSRKEAVMLHHWTFCFIKIRQVKLISVHLMNTGNINTFMSSETPLSFLQQGAGGCSAGLLFGWVFDLLASWLVAWLVGWLVGWTVGFLIGWFAGWLDDVLVVQLVY